MAEEQEKTRQEEAKMRSSQVTTRFGKKKKIAVNDFNRTYSQTMIEIQQKKQAQMEEYEKEEKDRNSFKPKINEQSRKIAAVG